MQLPFLTSLAVVLAAGLLGTILAHKTRIPMPLLLLLFGIALQQHVFPDGSHLEMPFEFVANIAIFALALIVFSGSTDFKIRDFDALTFRTLWFILNTIALNCILVGTGMFFALGGRGIAASLLFATASIAIGAEIVLGFIKREHRLVRILEIESILNDTPGILLPFLIVGVLINKAPVNLLSQISPFFELIITGLGTGLLTGLVLTQLLKLPFFRAQREISHLLLIVAALSTYVLAENLGGNGALAVVLAAIVLANSRLDSFTNLQTFLGEFSGFFQIIIFVLVGFVITLSYTWEFLITSVALFLLHITARYLAARLVFRNLSGREHMFAALVMPKGIVFAVVLLNLAAYRLPELDAILAYGSAFIVLSMVTSAIVGSKAAFFLQDVKEASNPKAARAADAAHAPVHAETT